MRDYRPRAQSRAQEQVHKLGKGNLCAAAESMTWYECTTQYADDDSRSNFAHEPARTENERRETRRKNNKLAVCYILASTAKIEEQEQRSILEHQRAALLLKTLEDCRLIHENRWVQRLAQK